MAASAGDAGWDAMQRMCAGSERRKDALIFSRKIIAGHGSGSNSCNDQLSVKYEMMLRTDEL